MISERDGGGSRRTLRATRGSLLAGSSAALAVSAHIAADGGLPDPALTAFLTVLIGWMATSLADRFTGVIGILGTLTVAQTLMHTVLTVLSEHPGAAVAVDPVAMTLAHAGATVVTAVLLGHAERGLLLIAASLRRLLPVMFSPAPPPSGPIAPVAAAVVNAHVEIVLRRLYARRGPPRYS